MFQGTFFNREQTRVQPHPTNAKSTMEINVTSLMYYTYSTRNLYIFNLDSVDMVIKYFHIFVL